jgi:hypothetical protein
MKTSSSLLEPRARGVVELGCRVTVREAQSRQVHTITLVSPGEADPERDRISTDSPLGRALAGAPARRVHHRSRAHRRAVLSHHRDYLRKNPREVCPAKYAKAPKAPSGTPQKP